MGWMEALVIFASALVVVLIVKVPRLMAPAHYFEIAELIHGMNAVTWQGVAIRFLAPVIVTTLATLSFRQDQPLIGLGIGLLSGLLLVWPAVIDSRLRPWQAYGKEVTLYLLYGMFISTFILLGLGTGLVTSYLEEPLEAALSGEGATAVAHALRSQVGSVVSGLVVLAFASMIGAAWRLVDKRLNASHSEEQGLE